MVGQVDNYSGTISAKDQFILKGLYQQATEGDAPEKICMPRLELLILICLAPFAAAKIDEEAFAEWKKNKGVRRLNLCRLKVLVGKSQEQAMNEYVEAARKVLPATLQP